MLRKSLIEMLIEQGRSCNGQLLLYLLLKTGLLNNAIREFSLA